MCSRDPILGVLTGEPAQSTDIDLGVGFTTFMEGFGFQCCTKYMLHLRRLMLITPSLSLSREVWVGHQNLSQTNW